MTYCSTDTVINSTRPPPPTFVMKVLASLPHPHYHTPSYLHLITTSPLPPHPHTHPSHTHHTDTHPYHTHPHPYHTHPHTFYHIPLLPMSLSYHHTHPTHILPNTCPHVSTYTLSHVLTTVVFSCAARSSSSNPPSSTSSLSSSSSLSSECFNLNRDSEITEGCYLHMYDIIMTS